MNNGFVIWNCENETGIPVLDEHHKGMAVVLNTFFYFLRKQQAEEVVMPTLTIIGAQSKLHMQARDMLANEADAPARKEHRDLHRAFVDALFRVSLKLKQDKDPVLLMSFLKYWWLRYLMHDAKFAKDIRENMPVCNE